MNFYQAGYYRVGKQGADAGWRVVSASDGMSTNAISGFEGIASAIVDRKNPNVPVINMGIYTDERFAYIVHVNYMAKGEDERGVTYIHCYCCGIKDFYSLVHTPEMIFGIDESAFPMEYMMENQRYPVVTSIPYKGMDCDELLSKYGISRDNCREIVLGALSALEGLTPSLCIVKNINLADYELFYKEMMYLVMCFVPVEMRVLMSSYSFSGETKARVYVTNVIDSSNYADLDAQDYKTDYSRLVKYSFTKIYNIDSINNATIKSFLRTIDEKHSLLTDKPYLNPQCKDVEVAFNMVLRAGKQGIDKSHVVDLIRDLLDFDLFTSPEPITFLVDLLHILNTDDIPFDDVRSKKKINSIYKKSNNRALAQEIDMMYARQVYKLPNDNEKAAELLKLRNESASAYNSVLEKIREVDYNLFHRLYVEKLLPSILSSLNSVSDHLLEIRDNEISDFLKDDYSISLKELLHLAKKEIDLNSSYEGLLSIEKKIRPITDSFSTFNNSMAPKVKECLLEIYAYMWYTFQPDWFEGDKEELYKYDRCLQLSKVAQSNKYYLGIQEAQSYLSLVELFTAEGLINIEVSTKIKDFVFGNIPEFSPSKKMELQRWLTFNLNFHGLSSASYEIGAFDSLLTLYYSSAKSSFDIVSWAKKMYDLLGDKAFEKNYIKDVVARSKIIGTIKYKEKMQENISVALEKGKNADISIPANIQAGLRRYLGIISGKEKNNIEMDGTSTLLTTFYRLFIGIATFGSIGLSVLRMSECLEHNEAMMTKGHFLLFASIGIAVMILLALMVKSSTSDGLLNAFLDSGLETPGQIILYFFIGILLVLGLCVAYVFKRPMVYVIVLMAYVLVGLVFMIINDRYDEEIR